MGEIDTRAVRSAASRIEQVASTVRDHVPDEVGDVASALPGSASAGAGTALATAWGEAFRGWATRADAQGQTLRDAAEAWESTNQGVARRFAGRQAVL